jgi:hypothetical protein
MAARRSQFPIRGSRRPAPENAACWPDDCVAKKGELANQRWSASSSSERFVIIPRCSSPPPPALAGHDQRPQAAVRQTARGVLSLSLLCLLSCGRPSQPSRTPAPHAVHCSITQRQLIIVPEGCRSPIPSSLHTPQPGSISRWRPCPCSHPMPMPCPCHARSTLHPPWWHAPRWSTLLLAVRAPLRLPSMLTATASSARRTPTDYSCLRLMTATVQGLALLDPRASQGRDD